MSFRSLVAGLAVSLVLAACGSDDRASTEPPPPPDTPPDTINLAPGLVVGEETFAKGNTPQGGQGDPVDGIPCETNEVVTYHIHAHLSLFVNGAQRAIPRAIGVINPQDTDSTGTFVLAGSCFYWLHTHDASGVVHIEMPSQADVTLGQFFDIWGQPLSTANVAGFEGTVTVYVDGEPYTDDPRAIKFAPHQEITLEVGEPLVTPPVYIFPAAY